MNRPLRLLWLIDSLNLGGAESLVATFAESLDDRSIDLNVCCLKTLGGNPYQDELRALEIPCTNLGSRNLRDLRAFSRLLRLIREKEIDLIHAHLNDATIWAALAAARTRRPWVATVHVSPPRKAWSRSGMRESLKVWFLRRRCPRVVAVSAALRDEYLQHTGIAADKMVVVHNGIDPSRFLDLAEDERAAARRGLELPTDGKLVSTVSVLREGKGLEVLLDAVPRVVEAVPEACFLIVGDGPLRQQLTARCRANGSSRHVRWAGFRRDVPRLLACSDLFVLPTLFDAFPTVILEAMASGLPVVASRVGGIPEMIDSPATGILVSGGDPRSLSRAIVDLLLQSERRQALGDAARRRILRDFSTATWTDQLVRIYSEAAGNRAAPTPPYLLENTGSG